MDGALVYRPQLLLFALFVRYLWFDQIVQIMMLITNVMNWQSIVHKLKLNWLFHRNRRWLKEFLCQGYSFIWMIEWMNERNNGICCELPPVDRMLLLKSELYEQVHLTYIYMYQTMHVLVHVHTFSCNGIGRSLNRNSFAIEEQRRLTCNGWTKRIILSLIITHFAKSNWSYLWMVMVNDNK